MTDKARNEQRPEPEDGSATEGNEQEEASETPPLAETLIESGAFEEDVTVEVAYEVIQLLSESSIPLH